MTTLSYTHVYAQHRTSPVLDREYTVYNHKLAPSDYCLFGPLGGGGRREGGREEKEEEEEEEEREEEEEETTTTWRPYDKTDKIL